MCRFRYQYHVHAYSVGPQQTCMYVHMPAIRSAHTLLLPHLGSMRPVQTLLIQQTRAAAKHSFLLLFHHITISYKVMDSNTTCPSSPIFVTDQQCEPLDTYHNLDLDALLGDNGHGEDIMIPRRPQRLSLICRCTCSATKPTASDSASTSKSGNCGHSCPPSFTTSIDSTRRLGLRHTGRT